MSRYADFVTEKRNWLPVCCWNSRQALRNPQARSKGKAPTWIFPEQKGDKSVKVDDIWKKIPRNVPEAKLSQSLDHACFIYTYNHRYMAEILPIRLKLYPINQSIYMHNNVHMHTTFVTTWPFSLKNADGEGIWVLKSHDKKYGGIVCPLWWIEK